MERNGESGECQTLIRSNGILVFETAVTGGDIRFDQNRRSRLASKEKGKVFFRERFKGQFFRSAQ